MVETIKVATKRDLRRFVDYVYDKYRGDPTFVPPLRMGEFDKLNPNKNPFFEHGRITPYLAVRDGKLVGRIACVDNDAHNEQFGDNLVFFGFFEAEDEEVAQSLFAAVEAEAKSLGRNAVRGPANPTMDDGAGFQIDAYDTKPFIMMPQNPSAYPSFAEGSGYAKIKDLYAWRIDIRDGATDRLERLADRVRKRYDITVRPADMKQFKREVGLLKHLYTVAWEENWGQVRGTDAEFDYLANDLKMIIEPDLALFLEYKGETVGLSITIPDLNQVLAKTNGRLFPTGIIHLLNRKKIINQGRLAILGVLKEHRRKGFEIVLIAESARRGRALGYVGGECGWVLEDNDAMNRGIEAAGGELYKTYRMYQKAL
jgi:GNAT superfamily N-acetyltransferase